MKVVTSAWCAEGKTVLSAHDGCFERQTPRAPREPLPGQTSGQPVIHGAAIAGLRRLPIPFTL